MAGYLEKSLKTPITGLELHSLLIRFTGYFNQIFLQGLIIVAGLFEVCFQAFDLVISIIQASG